VYVIFPGEEVCAPLLSEPPPETIVQAAVVAPPPILAPVNVNGAGVPALQTLSGPPAVTVAAALITIVLVALTAGHPFAGVLEVSVNVTFPVNPAAGV
jgi:hypothetical protein